MIDFEAAGRNIKLKSSDWN